MKNNIEYLKNKLEKQNIKNEDNQSILINKINDVGSQIKEISRVKIDKQVMPFLCEILEDEKTKKKFEELTEFKLNKMKLLYKMTRDGKSKYSMQNKIKFHSYLVFLIKTDEDKIFGGYTRCELDNPYSNKFKKDKYAFLFSLNLNKKFEIKQHVTHAIIDDDNFGIRFGNRELVLFDTDNNCYSNFGDSNCIYQNKGVSVFEFCGGERIGKTVNAFIPLEIEVYEVN